MKIITISREFGSGGRELGKRLAEELGYNYYDKEIVAEIAKETDLDPDYVTKVFQKGLSTFSLHFGSSLSGLSVVNQNSIDILVAQQKIIKSLAERGDCVIVGRSADAILKEYNPLNIFVYADMDFKIERCRNMGGGAEKLSYKELKKRIKQIDGGRAKTHALFSSTDWGDRKSYHLCVNTTGFNPKDLVSVVKEFAEKWFSRGNSN